MVCTVQLHQVEPRACHTVLNPPGTSLGMSLWAVGLIIKSLCQAQGKPMWGQCCSLLMGHHGANLAGASFVPEAVMADNSAETVTPLTNM